MQIYWNKNRSSHEKKRPTPTGFCLEHQHGHPLFQNTNMAAVTSCENFVALLIWFLQFCKNLAKNNVRLLILLCISFTEMIPAGGQLHQVWRSAQFTSFISTLRALYHIFSNKRQGAYLKLRPEGGALMRRRALNRGGRILIFFFQQSVTLFWSNL